MQINKNSRTDAKVSVPSFILVLPSLAWRPGSGTARRPTPGRSGHQLADTDVVDSKWRLLINSTALYSLGLQRHFRLLTSWAKRYWLSGEEGGPLPFRTARHLPTANP